jgi:starch synthase
VDYSEWNPERDPYLEVNYTSETVALKERVKSSLRAELGLENADVPLIGMVTRLANQKGLDELAAPGYGALPTILSELPAQMVILGSGEARYEYYLGHLERRFPNLKVIIGFDDRLAHRIEAASDFFLMPSRYEPCGLSQLYALRYGAVPIVTRTGGLADTVHELSQDGGTGIFIDHPCPAAILEAVKRAVHLWTNERNRFAAVQRTAMKERFTWDAAAKQYLSVYAKALKRLASSESA